MPLKREQSVVAIHSAPIIDNANARHSPALNPDLNRAGTGIDAVLDQFLHHRSGPLHNFASRDLAGDSFGKKFDPAHWDF
jgi:hypothetical protein